jgi:hypothetical protein
MTSRTRTPAGRPRRRRRAAGAALAAVAAGALGLAATTGGAPARAATHAASLASSTPTGLSASSFVTTWSKTLPDRNGPIGESSPIVGTLNGVSAVVVGDRDGNLWAFNKSTGTPLPGWPYHANGPIDSPPSIGANYVTVGVGDAGDSNVGGYLAVNANGTKKWETTVALAPGASTLSGVAAGLAYGLMQNKTAVVAGSLGQQEDELNASTGVVLPGFPWQQADTQFDTPAVANIYHNGKNYIIEGGASTANPAFNPPYESGGHMRVLDQTGNLGQPANNDGLACQHDVNEEVDSSPAVGDFLSPTSTGVVMGTGTYFANRSDEDAVIAFFPNCTVAWEAHLDGSTGDSPALVSALGGSGLQVAEGTSTGPNSGTVYLLNGSGRAGNGLTIWSTNVDGQVIGSITSANLGGGHQDLLVPTTSGLFVLDGTSGAVIAHLAQGLIGLQSAPLVTGDPDGLIGITIAGYNGNNTGEIIHYEVKGTNGSLADEAGAWPMFHHDPQLTGTTLPRLK